MVAPLLIPILTTLATKGLDLIGSAILAKGKDVVEKELGVDIESSLATEEGTQELKMKQMEHEEKLLQLALEDRKLDASYYQIDAEDRDSARKREIAVIENAEHAGWLNVNLVPIIALVVVFAGLTILYYHQDTDVKFAVSNLITMVLSYYFGNSSSGWKKDSAINNLSSKL
jgi:hypothetical protein